MCVREREAERERERKREGEYKSERKRQCVYEREKDTERDREREREREKRKRERERARHTDRQIGCRKIEIGSNVETSEEIENGRDKEQTLSIMIKEYTISLALHNDRSDR